MAKGPNGERSVAASAQGAATSLELAEANARAEPVIPPVSGTRDHLHVATERDLPRPVTEPAPGREAILVLGMHRSGTSALTGTLIRLGVDGPGTLMPADAHNERGYFESVPLKVLHDRLLAAAGSRWNDWRPLDPTWLATFEAEKFRAEARKLLLDEFGDARVVALKDPRACRFVPFWKEVLAEARTAMRAVIPVRAPIEVAQSLLTREGMPLSQGLLLWMRHALEAERETRDVPRAIVTMDAVLDDWRAVTAGMAEALGRPWPRALQEAGPEIDSFLTRDLKHQNASGEEESTLHAWANQAYMALCTLADRPEDRHARAVLDEIAVLFERACDLFGPLAGDMDQERKARTSAGKEAEAARRERDEARQALETERSRAAERQATLEATLAQARSEAQAAAAKLSEVAGRLDTERHQAAEEAAEMARALEAATAASGQLDSQLAQLRADAVEAGRRAGEQDAALRRQEELIGRLEAELEAGRRRAVGDEARLALLDRLHAEQTETLVEARRQLAAERERADAATRDLAARTAAVAVLEGGLQEERARRDESEARAAALAQEAARLEVRLQASLAAEKSRADAADAAARAREAQIAHLNRLLDDAETTRATLLQELDRQREETARAEEDASRAERRLVQEGSRADEAEALAQERQDELDRLAAELSGLRSSLGQAESERSRLSARVEETSRLLGQKARELEDVRRELDASRAAAAQIPALQGKVKALEGNVADRFRELATLTKMLVERDADLQRRTAQADALREHVKWTEQDLTWKATAPLRLLGRTLTSRHRRNRRLIEASGLFDPAWYLAQNPDVAAAGVDPLDHYLRHGASEGRAPSPSFNPVTYLTANPDVAAAGANPLVHYVEHGRLEMRLLQS